MSRKDKRISATADLSKTKDKILESAEEPSKLQNDLMLSGYQTEIKTVSFEVSEMIESQTKNFESKLQERQAKSAEAFRLAWSDYLLARTFAQQVHNK